MIQAVTNARRTAFSVIESFPESYKFAGLLFCAAAACQAQTYNVHTFVGSVNGANDSGEAVGTINGSNDMVYGFKYQDGVLRPVSSPRAGFRTGDSTVITSLNGKGEVLGYYGRSVPDNSGDFTLSPSGSYTYIGVSSHTSPTLYAFGLNNLGDIVGSTDVSGPSSGFKLSGGVYTYFSVPAQAQTIAFGINDSGQIVGETGAISEAPTQGFLYDNGVYTLISHPNSYITVLTGINNLGVMAGYYQTTDQLSYVGFTYSGGVFTDISLPQLGTNSVQILGITNAGVLYGSYGVLRYPYYPSGFVANPVSGDSGTLEHIDLWQE